MYVWGWSDVDEVSFRGVNGMEVAVRAIHFAPLNAIVSLVVVYVV